jgi:hypothetical protein
MTAARITRIVGWISFGLLAVLNLLAGASKFFPVDPASEQAKMMLDMGVTPSIAMTLGVIELASVVLFLIPRTSTVGFVLLTGYLSGALATILTHGQPIGGMLPIMALLAICGWCHFPELTARLRGQPVA